MTCDSCFWVGFLGGAVSWLAMGALGVLFVLRLAALTDRPSSKPPVRRQPSNIDSEPTQAWSKVKP